MDKPKHEIVYLSAERYSGQPARAAVVAKEAPNGEAQFAMAIIERFALIAGEDDGEDRAGRQKTRRMSADEIAAFACDVAASSFDEFRERGWMIDFPDQATIEERAREQAERN